MELLMPAGNIDKLKTALLYGADAIYLGGERFGLRAASLNFSLEEIKTAVAMAHSRNAKIYVTLNSFLHEEDFKGLRQYITALEEIGCDAYICSDLGVVSYFNKIKVKTPIHLSTQASCLNAWAGKLWKKMGITRLVLGREVSLSDAAKIKQMTGLEVELFVAGSMCSSYSGQCVISNFTKGRDSNRGGCSHSCRFEYKIKDSSEENGHFFSSKDLLALNLVEDFRKYEIDSLKVEGRMKGPLYLAIMSRLFKKKILQAEIESEDFKLLNLLPHRGFQAKALEGFNLDQETIADERNFSGQKDHYLGQVIAKDMLQGILWVQVKNPLVFSGRSLHVLPFDSLGAPVVLVDYELQNLNGEAVSKLYPNQVLALKVKDKQNLELISSLNIIYQVVLAEEEFAKCQNL